MSDFLKMGFGLCPNSFVRISDVLKVGFGLCPNSFVRMSVVLKIEFDVPKPQTSTGVLSRYHW
jgi:hypothetical protein